MDTSVLKKYTMEFIGAFFIVFTMLARGKPIALGLMLTALMYIGTNVSGGHYNPAVTFAMWLKGKFAFIHLPGYIFFQIMGAFAASVLFYYFFGKVVVPAPITTLGLIKPTLMEMLGTFVFCAVYLETTSLTKQAVPINCFVVGLSLAAVAFMIGPFSGGVINPAMGLGPILFDAIKGGHSYSFLAVYLIGPVIGAVLASVFYRCLHNDESL